MLSLHTRRVSMDISYSTEVLKDKLENREKKTNYQLRVGATNRIAL